MLLCVFTLINIFILMTKLSMKKNCFYPYKTGNTKKKNKGINNSIATVKIKVRLKTKLKQGMQTTTKDTEIVGICMYCRLICLFIVNRIKKKMAS